MTDQEMYHLKFPVGDFNKPERITKEHLDEWISTITTFPKYLKAILKDLSEKELGYRYRPEGWTIRQVVHHCADSHINSIVRFKLAKTEDKPTIRPYFEDRFARLVDYKEPLDDSIAILKGVHNKLGLLLKSFNQSDLKREFVHPEHGKVFSIEQTIGVYAWHCKHHYAHIEQALKFKDKYN